MTTLTREALFNSAKIETEKVEVAEFGSVLLRQQSELMRLRRESQLFDSRGNLVAKHQERRRVYTIIDQVMNEDATPMFSDADVDDLLGLCSKKLDPLYVAIQEFNYRADPKKTEESNDSESS